MDTNTYVVSVDRTINASPEDLFAIVADCARHPEIDGSGAVHKVKPGAPKSLEMGSTFGMSMRMGMPYSMNNKVIEFEPFRRIAWQTVAPGPFGRFVGGRIWRYEFEPVHGGTKVTESWDISQDHQRSILKRIGKVASETENNMRKTLDRLAASVES